VLALLTAYPALLWLVGAPSFGRLMVVELWFSFLFASYNGALIVFLTEIMRADVRTVGFSFVHSSATAIFGGFAPAISTYLIHATGNRAVRHNGAFPHGTIVASCSEPMNPRSASISG
jgi:hypothetical protein